MSNSTPPLRPGTPTPNSGQYIEVGPRGGSAGNREITGVQGKPLPPSSKPGNGHLLVDPTNNGAGRNKR